jgi:hypothetical protein
MEQLNPNALDAIAAITDRSIVIFGATYSRELVTMALMAVLFFLGVIIGFVLKLNGEAKPLPVLLGSIVVFFLSSPVSARVLSGNWGETPISALDQVVNWIAASGPLPNTFFAFGVVMVFGLMSWPMLQLLIKWLRRILALGEGRIAPPPANPPAAPPATPG